MLYILDRTQPPLIILFFRNFPGLVDAEPAPGEADLLPLHLLALLAAGLACRALVLDGGPLESVGQ